MYPRNRIWMALAIGTGALLLLRIATERITTSPANTNANRLE